ncbi:hypothetical protein JTE90_026457 [Oedothorax gibbosus]|uniref:Uncharacterized protein n=1 Tax=Oedothorax gibbosus TaxID=931172 RepID=A0AAV6VRQ7_9ARAC|nr:hypothetical protein JTE90_026457 [Oedothorax gibbosus]
MATIAPVIGFVFILSHLVGTAFSPKSIENKSAATQSLDIKNIPSFLNKPLESSLEDLQPKELKRRNLYGVVLLNNKGPAHRATSAQSNQHS